MSFVLIDTDRDNDFRRTTEDKALMGCSVIEGPFLREVGTDMSESDLGPIIGSIEPMEPIRKPLLLPDHTCALQRAGAAGFVAVSVWLFAAVCFGVLLWTLYTVFPPVGM